MSKKTTSDFLPEDPLPKVRAVKTVPMMSPIDESEEFYDPFSDLSLFLASKIKNELLRENNPKQWSKKIQDLLLKQILPEFNLKFPKYRLGVTALKKTWEKVRIYLDSVDERKEALCDDGSLNVPFMIRENLKECLFKKAKTNLLPYHQAHQLAVKISECIAALEGTRTDLEEMARLIWSLQKHLIIPQEEHIHCPYERHGAIDRLIVRCQLEELANQPTLSEKQLAQNVQKKLSALGSLSRIRHVEDLSPSLWALLADKMYPHLSIHKRLAPQELEKLQLFVQKECRSYLQGENPDFTHLVKRILLLYRLASKMSKPSAEKQLEAAISYVLSLSSDRIQTEIPVLRQEVYTFIQYEILSVKQQREEAPLEKVLQTLVRTFEEIQNLPSISDQDHKDLELIIWKAVHQECNLLAKTPYYLREILAEELINIHIESPDESSQNIVHRTLANLKNLQNLPFPEHPLSSNEPSKIVYSWSRQGDLIYGWLHFDKTSCIGKIIKKLWKQLGCTEAHVCHSEFIAKVIEKVLEEFPFFANDFDSIRSRATIMYKHFWYNDLRSSQETSFDRFLKWHYIALTNEEQMQFAEMIIEHLDDLCKNSLPLIPFHRDYVRVQTLGGEGYSQRQSSVS